MARKKVKIAIAYDFDGTLAPGNMQEYNFFPALNMKSEAFWSEVKHRAKEQNADEILAYMVLMLEKAKNKRIPVKKEDFVNYGKGVDLFPGVDSWFSRIKNFAKTKSVDLEHFVISSGIREMVEGTSISKEFSAIYASSFMYDENGVAYWPALAVNYTTKTQYLFRINKGCLDVFDNSEINKYTLEDKRPIPFSNMIYIGDGETDVPCMKLVKEHGGHSVAVYKKNTKGAREKVNNLIKHKRVDFISAADYSEGNRLEKVIQGIIQKVVCDTDLKRLRKCQK